MRCTGCGPQHGDQQFARWVMLHVQSNPLPSCTRPRVLIKGTVERDSQFRQCAECGIWFELAPGTARADKLDCSTPCRTKAYRKRQAEAVHLHGEGRSIDGIARELESDPDTVRGWIERKLGQGAAPQGETE